jgi:hypothetical protein
MLTGAFCMLRENVTVVIDFVGRAANSYGFHLVPF